MGQILTSGKTGQRVSEEPQKKETQKEIADISNKFEKESKANDVDTNFLVHAGKAQPQIIEEEFIENEKFVDQRWLMSQI